MEQKTPTLIPAGTILGVVGMLVLAAFFSSAAEPGLRTAAERVPILPPDRTLNVPAMAYDQSLTAMEWTAWAALAAALCSFLSMLIILWTLVTTRGMLKEARNTTKAAVLSVDVTREMGQAQVRCYPSITKLDVSHNFEFDHPEATLKWRNSGNSPARRPRLSIRTVYTIVNVDEDRSDEIAETWHLEDLEDLEAQTETNEFKVEVFPFTAGINRALSDPSTALLCIDVEAVVHCNDVFREAQCAFKAARTVYQFFGGELIQTFASPLTSGFNAQETSDIIAAHQKRIAKHRPA